VLYHRAHDFLDKQKTADGLDVLRQVIVSKLPDPHGLKTKAKDERDKIVSDVAAAQKTLEISADQYQHEGHYKEAIQALRKALAINPENEVVKGHLASSLLELRKLMQPIYQESVVEESVGDVEKAKEKWKRIQDNSIIGEEYYEKSRLKLKKYGLL
jgi:tetratricopeptide (TPR) repeat protein